MFLHPADLVIVPGPPPAPVKGAQERYRSNTSSAAPKGQTLDRRLFAAVVKRPPNEPERVPVFDRDMLHTVDWCADAQTERRRMNTNHARRVYFEQIRRVVPLAAILERYGILSELKRVGSSHKGCCPIHKGNNRRQFAADLQKNVWKCFSPECERGGGVLELVAELEHVDLLGAARLIAGWFAIGTSTRSTNHHNQERRPPMSGGKPSHKVYVVDDPEGDAEEKGWWTRIGSAWPHKDGKGLNIQLQALPVGNRIVLREYTDDDHKADEEKKTKRGKK